MKPYIKTGKTTTYANKCLNPPRKVTIWKYNDQDVSDTGSTGAKYTQFVKPATVQIPTEAEIEQYFKMSAAANRKKFWFDENIVHSLNRNFDVGNDWLQFANMMYVVEIVVYEALDDFVVVFGREDASFTGNNPDPKPMSPYMSVDILR